MRRRRKRVPKRSKLACPRVAKALVGESRALKVHPSQVAEANQVAQSMGCGAPFRRDGMYEDSRANKKRYMRELNRRAVDNGQDRIVNFDGGYGDET